MRSMVSSRTSRRAHFAGCGWFWAWALLGSAAALGAVSSLGPILAVPVLAIVALMAGRPGIRRSAFGLLSGAGALLLYVAWVQRAGHDVLADANGEWVRSASKSLPWLLVGIVLFIVGIAAHARRA